MGRRGTGEVILDTCVHAALKFSQATLRSHFLLVGTQEHHRHKKRRSITDTRNAGASQTLETQEHQASQTPEFRPSDA